MTVAELIAHLQRTPPEATVARLEHSADSMKWETVQRVAHANTVNGPIVLLDFPDFIADERSFSLAYRAPAEG